MDFRGRRDPKGYRLTNHEDLGRVIVRNGRDGEPLVPCPPLAGEEFRHFASTAGDAEGALAFVQRYGPLTFGGEIATQGDSVDHVTRDARIMRRLLDGVTSDPRRLSAELLDEMTMASISSVRVALTWDPATKAPMWVFFPDKFRDALWLQFGQAVSRGDQLRACRHCGVWFEAGIGAGRRADAKFCSDEHRAAFNSLKRSRRA